MPERSKSYDDVDLVGEPSKKDSDVTAETQDTGSDDNNNNNNNEEGPANRERRGDRTRGGNNTRRSKLLETARVFDKNVKDRNFSEPIVKSLPSDFVAPTIHEDSGEPITFGNTQLPNTLHFVNSTLSGERQMSLTENIKKAKNAPRMSTSSSNYSTSNRSLPSHAEFTEKARRLGTQGSSKRRQDLLDESRHRKNTKLTISAMKNLVNNNWVRKRKDLTKPAETPVVFRNFRATKLSPDFVAETYQPPVNPKTEFQRKLIMKAIKNTFVLKDNKKEKELIQAMEPVAIPKNGILYEQGKENTIDKNQFYVIEEGTIEVMVDGVTVDTLHKGTAFGQERLLMGGDNQATVKASEDSKLFKLDQNTYRAVMQAGEAVAVDDPNKKTPITKKQLQKQQEEKDAAAAAASSKTTTGSSSSNSGGGDNTGTTTMKKKKKDTKSSLLKDSSKSSSSKKKSLSMDDSTHMSTRSKYKGTKSADNSPAGSDNESSPLSSSPTRGATKASTDGFHKVAAMTMEEKIKTTTKGKSRLSIDSNVSSSSINRPKKPGASNSTIPDSYKKKNPELYAAAAKKKKKLAAKKKKQPKTKIVKKIIKKRIKKEKREPTLEESPVFQQQQALRKSVQKYASDKDDLEMIRVLGEGQFGQVWLVAATLPDQDPNRQEFALKLQSLDDEEREDAVDEIKRECKSLQELHHPFIANLVHVYEAPDSMDMLMGLIKGGELWDVVHQQDEETEEWTSGIPEWQSKFYAFLLADTFCFLKDREYVFRDLKPENVMLDEDGYPVLVDFGFAKPVAEGEKTFTFCGTPNYVAPEVIKNAGHSYEVDHWALGVVIYEMISGENPFFYDDMEQFALYQAISEEDPYPMGDDVDPSTEVLDLLDLIFVKDPEDRLDIEDIVLHEWFDDMPDLKQFRGKKLKAPRFDEILGKAVYDPADGVDPDDDKTEYTEIDVEIEEEVLATDSESEEEEEEDDLPPPPPPPMSPKEWTEKRVDKKPDGTTIHTTIHHMQSPGGTKTTKTKMSLGNAEDWRKKKNLQGYYAKQRSAQEKESSKSRRGQLMNFLDKFADDDVM